MAQAAHTTGGAYDAKHESLILNPATTALMLIDLQNAIVGREMAPHSAGDVTKRGGALTARFREVDAMVIYVRVDLANLQMPLCDQPARDPNAPPPPPTASEISPDAGMLPQDAVISGTRSAEPIWKARITPAA